MQRGVAFRQDLENRVSAEPMARMLEANGVSREEYLASEQVVQIETHLRKCMACEEKGSCKKELDAGVENPGEGYCPNHEDFVNRPVAEPDPELRAA